MGIENSLFKWNRFNCCDVMVISFSDIELVVDIGKFKDGHRFDFASIDYEGGHLEICNFKRDKDGNIVQDEDKQLVEDEKYNFDLVLTVKQSNRKGEKLNEIRGKYKNF